jgi:hypothetical protein
MTLLVVLQGPAGILATLVAVPADAGWVHLELRVDAPGQPLRICDFGDERTDDTGGAILELAEALRASWRALGFTDAGTSASTAH